MTDQKHYPMPELSDQEHEVALLCAKNVISASWSNEAMKLMAQAALAALTAPKADPSRLADLLPRKKDFANEMSSLDDPVEVSAEVRSWNACIDEASQLLSRFEGLYKEPPVPALKPIEFHDCDKGAVSHMSGGSDEYCNGFVDGTQNAIRILRSLGYEVKE